MSARHPEVDPSGPPPVAFRNFDLIERVARGRPARSDLVFVLVDPWAVRVCRRDLMARFRREGFRLVAFAYASLGPSDIEQIYRKEAPLDLGVNSGWHIVTSVYETGSACGMVLHHSNASPSASALMRRRKGLVLGPPGTIRPDLNAPNDAIHLFHAADDWSSFLHEALVVFGPDRLERVLDTDPASCADTVEDRFDDSRYAGIEAVNAIRATELLVALRLRVLSALQESCQAELRALHLLWRAYQDGIASLDVREETRRYLDLIAAEQPFVPRFLELVLRDGCDNVSRRFYVRHRGADVAAVQGLFDPRSYSSVDGHWMARHLPVLDRWEEILLVTTLHHFDNLCVEMPKPAGYS